MTAMSMEEMKKFAEFQKKLPRRFHKLDNEIGQHIESCWKCRNLPFFLHKELKKKMRECEQILKENEWRRK